MSDPCENDIPSTPPIKAGYWRPPWLDAGYVLATNLVQHSDITINSITGALVAGNNPRRWGLGFAWPQSNTQLYNIAPWPDANVAWVGTVGSGQFIFFSLFTYGPLVTGEWYATASTPTVVRIVEVMNN